VGLGGQRHAPAALPPGKTWYLLYRRLGGPQGRSGRGRKIFPTNGLRSPDRPARPVPIPTEPSRPTKISSISVFTDRNECIWIFFCNIRAFRPVINAFYVGVGKPTRFDGRVECDRLNALSGVMTQDAVRVQSLCGLEFHFYSGCPCCETEHRPTDSCGHERTLTG
jgi:hypothetical protein